MKTQKGSILMISLWILAILVIFAVGLGQRASINLRLARYQKQSLEAGLLAQAGLYRGIAELKNDQNAYDYLHEAWSSGRDTAGKALLEKIELEKESGKTFSVKYLYDKEKDIYYCMSDEERKININGVEPFDKNKIITLLNVRQVDDAESLAETVIEWIKPLSKIDTAKKENFTQVAELLPVFEYFYQQKGSENYREMASGAFMKIKDIITVNSAGQLNINTSSPEALSILFKAYTATNTVSSLIEADADNLAGRIIQFRQGGFFDNPNPEDINVKLQTQGASLSTGQINLLAQLCAGYISVKSNNFGIESTGNVRGASKKIIAIYNRVSEKLVYWHQN